jgi:hypothetical protein
MGTDEAVASIHLSARGSEVVPTVNVPLTCETPAVAVIFTVVLLLTGNVLTANCTEFLPDGTITNDGG